MAKQRPATTRKSKGTVGRPRIEFDMDTVQGLAAIQCTLAEIAAVCQVSEDTITRRLEEDPVFAEVIKKGRESGRESLRRVQWKLALRGHPTMLIWLGKQHLGQRDKFEHTGADGGPIRTRNEVNPADLSTETLRRLQGELAEIRAKEAAVGKDGEAVH
jgi:hypothetical protein